MNAAEALLRFRRSVWFRVLYVGILAFLLSVLLVLIPLSWILVPVTLLVIPYWLRERGYKKYIVNGLVALLGGILILTATTTSSFLGESTSPVLRGGTASVALSNGTVEPFRGGAGEDFTFAVDVRTNTSVSPSDVQVWLNMSFYDASLSVVVPPGVPLAGENATDVDLTDGKRYILRTPLLKYVYVFSFTALVNVSSSPVFVKTFSVAGPFVLVYGELYAVLLVFISQAALAPGILYFVALGVHRMYRRSQRIRGAALKRPAEPVRTRGEEGGYTCTNCGADAPEDAARCPSCGAVFEEGPSLPPAERPAPKEGRDQER